MPRSWRSWSRIIRPDRFHAARREVTIDTRLVLHAGHGEEIARLFLGNLRDHAAFALDARGNVLSWNAGAERLLGYREDEVVGVPSAGLLTPEDGDGQRLQRDLDIALATGRAEREEWISRRDGSRFPATRILFGMLDERESVRWVLEVLRDVTDRRIQEEHLQVQFEQLAVMSEFLRESDARFHAMIEAVVDYAIFFVEADGRIKSWNQGARKITGFEDLDIQGKDLSLVLPDPEAAGAGSPRLLAAAEAEGRAHLETQGIRRDGSRFPADIVVTAVRLETGALRGFCVILQDLTERRESEAALRVAEEQLRQSQKMEAIGRLAGGVAHDFNNLLTAIMGFSELGLGLVGKEQNLRFILEEISRASRTAADLTRRLLAVSRKQALTPIVLDLGGIVMESAPMLQRILGSDIVFTTRLAPPGSTRIKADRGMLDQILLNLAVNAKDAMPAGGTLAVETRVTELRAPAKGHKAVIPSGRYATLIVRDSGTGMDEDVKAHLFEPFFTTKEKGKGTGLGLSTTYGIVRQSGGEIEVASAPGRGTAFTIHLPLAEESPERGVGADVQAARTRADGEKVLVVDDEEMVRSLVRNILEKAGYRVLPAGSGHEALEVWRREEGNIQALLTDVVMPGMNGLDLAERLQAEAPQLTIVVMSGYPADVDMDDFFSRKGFLFLDKPFSADKLLQMLKGALQAGR